MANPNPTGSWVSGESGNPNGRPVGARNKRTSQVLELIENRGDRDPIDLSSEIANNTSLPPEVRAPYVRLVADFKHSKMASTPPLRYVEHPIPMPKFETVEDAERFLGSIPSLVNEGQLDRDLAQEYSTLTKNWIDAKYARDELRLKMAQANTGDQEQVIRIQGGLPALPGTNITMPQLNRHSLPEIPAPSPALGEPSAEALGSSTNDSVSATATESEAR